MRPFENPTDEAPALPRHLTEVVAALPPYFIGLVNALPRWLLEVVASAPVYVDRKRGADLLTQYLERVSSRSLEVWRLPWWHVNGRAHTLTIVLFAVGYAKLAVAPMIMGGRRAAPEQQAAAGAPQADACPDREKALQYAIRKVAEPSVVRGGRGVAHNARQPEQHA